MVKSLLLRICCRTAHFAAFLAEAPGIAFVGNAMYVAPTEHFQAFLALTSLNRLELPAALGADERNDSRHNYHI